MTEFNVGDRVTLAATAWSHEGETAEVIGHTGPEDQLVRVRLIDRNVRMAVFPNYLTRTA